MKNFFIKALLFVSVMVSISCKDDEDDDTSIIGTWRGTVVDLTFRADIFPIPLNEERETDYTLELREDGTAIINFDGTESYGSWEYGDNNKEIVASLEFLQEFLDPTETFSIAKLSQSALTLYIEKDGTFPVPDVGDVEGTVEVTLPMTRME